LRKVDTAPVSPDPPTEEHEPPERERRPYWWLIPIGVILLVIIVFAFGRAILNGDYFGECDHVVGKECDIVHVLGVVMHRDVERETVPASTQTTPTTTETTTPPPNNEGPAARDFTSPCTVYVKGHNAMVEITGSGAATECEHFVSAAGQTPWTTEAQVPTESRTVVCELTNHSDEHAAVTDTGGHTYGSEACKQLSGEGWG
jgi:hypothetical protein